MHLPAAHLLALAFAIALSVAAFPGTGAEPQPKPFAAGDPAAGQMIVNKGCVGCHARRFNGEPKT